MIISFLINFIAGYQIHKILSNLIINYGIILFVLLFFYTLKLKTKRYKKVQTKTNKNFISIIVPAKNEEDNIEKTLDGLKSIEYNKELYEIIIVNDNSTDNTLQILNNSSLPSNFKIVDRKRKSGFVAGVLNDGIKFISDKSDVIGIIDSDTIPTKDILKVIDSYFVEGFKGAIQPQEWHYNNKDSVLTTSQHILCIYENYQNIDECKFKIGHFYSTDIIKEMKYNEKSILEDVEMSLEINKSFEVIPIKDVLVYRTFHNNIKAIYSQQYRYQLGSIMYAYKNKFFLDDMIIPIILFFNLISIPYIGILNFIKFNLIIFLIIFNLVYYSIGKHFRLSYLEAISNCPNELVEIISKQGNYNLIDVFYATCFAYSILVIRIFPFFRLPFSLEKIVWNRFS